MALTLRLRTPRALLVDEEVAAIDAEDLDGWFGLRPGRADLVAALPPGLLIFRDGQGDGFVALAGGLLDLHEGECRVTCRVAVMSRELDEVAAEIDRQLARRDARAERDRDAMTELAREALRRLAEHERAG